MIGKEISKPPPKKRCIEVSSKEEIPMILAGGILSDEHITFVLLQQQFPNT